MLKFVVMKIAVKRINILVKNKSFLYILLVYLIFLPFNGFTCDMPIESSIASYSSTSEFDLRINEICPSNSTTIADNNGEYDDWIEIFNTGTESVDLNNMYISDDMTDPFKWQLTETFEGELILEPNDFILLWADKQSNQGGQHLGFSLSMTGEDLLLSSSSFELIDSHTYTQSLPDISFGWDTNSESWKTYTSPTPEMINGESDYLGIAPKVIFSENGGLYTSNISLTLSSPIANDEIRYTLDGTLPTESSPLYSSPIGINTNSVVRAIVYIENYLPSLVSSSSYIYDTDLDLDIISIVADDTDLWGSDGIYQNPFSGDEIRVSCSHFSVNNELYFSQDLGMKIHAPDSRSQKSMRFYARNDYGSSSIDAQLFEQKPYSDSKRFILRNSGNDGVEIGHTALRDPLISQLFHTLDSEEHGYAAYQPVNVFLNGEYWGIYNIRERQDNNWHYQQYGYSENEMDYLERTAEQSDTRFEWAGDWDDYDLMEETAINLDLSDEDNYQLIQDWMNIENFVDYQFLEIFICNQDWLSNNMKFWKPLDNSRKWEWIIWDTDWGFGTYYPSYPHGFPDWDALSFSVSNWGGWTSDVETELLQNLVESPTFRDYFCTRGADILNSYLLPERIIPQLTSYADRISPDIDKQISKWGGSVSEWSDDVEYMGEFITERPNFVREHFAERFEAGAIYEIALDAIPSNGGYIEVNTIETDILPWIGKYYEEIPVRIKAVANLGFQFDHWEETGSEEIELWVNMNGNQTFTAIFEEIEDISFPIINEVFYNPTLDYDPGEWIEIYNPNLEPLQMSSWTFEDTNNEYLIPEGTVIPTGEFLILCSDTLKFKLLHPSIDNILGNFSFSLSNEGETISIKDPMGIVMDEVNYEINSPWPILSGQVSPSIELLLPELNNNIGTNWFANELDGGSPSEVNQIIIGLDDITIETHISIYPNPFSSEVNLVLSLQNEGSVNIRIYNSLGQSIKTITDVDQQETGLYKYIWNGTDQDNNKVPSGVYFFRIETNGEIHHTQAILTDS